MKKIFVPILISTCLLKGMEERQMRAGLLIGLDQLWYVGSSYLLDRIEGLPRRQTNKARCLWQLLGKEGKLDLKFLAAATLLENPSLISNNIPQDLTKYLCDLKNDMGKKMVELVSQHEKPSRDHEEREELSQLFLLIRRANLNIVDEHGNTALMCASHNGNRLIVGKLIQSGANINVQTHSTALIIAIINGHDDIADLLINAGADLDLTDKDGNTALICAAKLRNSKIAKKLIEVGANTDIQDKDGNTALIHAAKKGNTKIAKKLIKAFADADIKNKDGNTALILSISSCDRTTEHESSFATLSNKRKNKIAKQLIISGADLNLQDNNGYTALMWAIYKGKTEIATLLSNCEAEINISSIIKCTLI